MTTRAVANKTLMYDTPHIFIKTSSQSQLNPYPSATGNSQVGEVFNSIPSTSEVAIIYSLWGVVGKALSEETSRYNGRKSASIQRLIKPRGGLGIYDL